MGKKHQEPDFKRKKSHMYVETQAKRKGAAGAGSSRKRVEPLRVFVIKKNSSTIQLRGNKHL